MKKMHQKWFQVFAAESGLNCLELVLKKSVYNTGTYKLVECKDLSFCFLIISEIGISSSDFRPKFKY